VGQVRVTVFSGIGQGFFVGQVKVFCRTGQGYCGTGQSYFVRQARAIFLWDRAGNQYFVGIGQGHSYARFIASFTLIRKR
jgi:hypothetical protein